MHFKVEVDTCNSKTNFQESPRPIGGRRDTNNVVKGTRS